jgi:hypothetical protein
MNQWRDDWRRHWRQHWGQYPHAWGGSWIAGSFLSLLLTIVSLVGLCAVLSLILTGSIFTFGLPAGMPLWVGIVLLFLIFHIIKWPLRVARHAAYYHGAVGPGYHYGAGSFLCGLFWWIAVFFFVMWIANHHSVRAHEVLDQVRHDAHVAVDQLRDWWNRP